MTKEEMILEIIDYLIKMGLMGSRKKENKSQPIDSSTSSV